MRRRKRALLSAFALSGLFLSACELTVSLDGLTGGGGRPDASSPGDAAVAPHIDSGIATDAAGSPDATTPLDAGAKDGATAEAGQADSGGAAPDASFCSSQAATVVFCDDFDHGALGVVWDNVLADNGGVTTDSSEALSPPSSALFSINKVGATPAVDVELNKSFPPLAGERMTATLSFDILFDEVDEQATPASTIIAGIDLVDPQSNEYEVQVDVQYHPDAGVVPTIAQMAISSSGATTGYLDKSTGVPIPLGKWTQVQFVYHLPYPDAGSSGSAATSNALDLNVGGATIASIQVFNTIANGTPRIILGTGYVSGGSNPWKFHIDNVTLDAVPLP